MNRPRIARFLLLAVAAGALSLPGCQRKSSSGIFAAPGMVPRTWAQVSAGYDHTVAVHVDGSLWGWGGNYFGHLGLGTSGYGSEYYSPVQIDTGTDWVSTASGSYSTIALKKDGTLWSCGYNFAGQLGLGTTTSVYQLTRVGTDVDDWSALSLVSAHVLALKSDGSLWSWGSNQGGVLGQGTSGPGTDALVPMQVGSETDWSRVLAGDTHSLALKNDGTMWGWGTNTDGQVGDGTNIDRAVPTPIGLGKSWAKIEPAGSRSLAIAMDGTLWTWGDNIIGQLGLGTSGEGTNENIPVKIGSGTDWYDVSAGGYHALALRMDGSLWTWGTNYTGQLGDGSYVTRTAPARVAAGSTWARIVTGTVHSFAWKLDGSLWSWGYNVFGQLGNGAGSPMTVPVQIESGTDWTAIAGGLYFTLGRKSDGTLHAWGRNNYGQLGIDSRINQNKSVPMGTSTNWSLVDAGGAHTVAIDTGGSLWTWGENIFGQLGNLTNGEGTEKQTPLFGGGGWSTADTGGQHVLSIKTDGTLWTWGNNGSGQLAIPMTTQIQDFPVQADSSTDWIRVSAGGYHSLAIREAGPSLDHGTLWAWGSNGYGQLGDETNTDTAIPVQVGTFTDTFTDWKVLSTGDGHSAGIRTGGSLWTWGSNGYGQLGDETTTNRNTPVQIGTGFSWTAVSAGEDFTVALRSDGTLWACGNNDLGQLGDGTSAANKTLGQVGTASDWMDVTAGGHHSIGRKADGLWAWGQGSYGQLGDGHRWFPTPVEVP